VRVRAAQQILPVEVGLGLAPGLVDAQQPAGGDAQVPLQPGLGGDLPAQQLTNRILISGERHLRTVLAQYAAHYNGRRPHRALQLRPPRPDHPALNLDRPLAFAPDGRFLATVGADKTVLLWDVSDPAHPRRVGDRLDGLLHEYQQVA
jgi:WD40 repeat protein